MSKDMFVNKKIEEGLNLIACRIVNWPYSGVPIALTPFVLLFFNTNFQSDYVDINIEEKKVFTSQIPNAWSPSFLTFQT